MNYIVLKIGISTLFELVIYNLKQDLPKINIFNQVFFL